MHKSHKTRPFFKFSAVIIIPIWFLSACAKPYVFPSDQSQITPRLYEDRAVMDDSYTLPLRSWGDTENSTAVILANHGLNDYSFGFDSTGEYLADRNIVLISYDQRGFGESEGHGYWHGSQRMVDDNLTLIRLLREKYPEKSLFLLGESMGGAIVLSTLAQLNPEAKNEISGVVLIAPAIWSRQSMPWYQRGLLWLAVHTFPEKELTGEGLDIMPSDNIEMLRALGRDPLVIKATRVDVLYGVTNLMDLAVKDPSSLPQSSLILYGKNDQIVPRKPTCQWLETLPKIARKNTIIYENGYHMLNRDLQAQRVLDDIAGWIERQTIDKSSDTANITDLAELTGNNKTLADFCSQK